MNIAALVLAVWAEFLSPEEIQNNWDLLKSQEHQSVILNLAVRTADVESGRSFSLIKAAAAQGVTVRPWFLLSEEQGYWLNVWTVKSYAGLVSLFLEGARSAGIAPGTLIFDLESPYWQMKRLAACPADPFLRCPRAILKENQNSEVFRQGAVAIRGLVAQVQSAGWKVKVVTAPFPLHDLSDSKQRYQYLFGIPLEGIGWDSVSFMIYRPEFESRIGYVGSRIVYDYARLIRRHFGERGGIELGETGDLEYPLPVKGFQDPSELAADVGAARAAGISEIGVYSLDLILKQPNPGSWLSGESRSERPSRNVKTGGYIFLLDRLKRLLPSPR